MGLVIIFIAAAVIIKDYHSVKKVARLIIFKVILPYVYKKNKILADLNISAVKLKPKFIFVLFQLLGKCLRLGIRKSKQFTKKYKDRVECGGRKEVE